jgi:hypothetical protein
MKLFENGTQLADSLRTLSEAGLLDIAADDDGAPRFRLSAAVLTATKDDTRLGPVEPIPDARDGT